jgi:hypothetical protein
MPRLLKPSRPTAPHANAPARPSARGASGPTMTTRGASSRASATAPSTPVYGRASNAPVAAPLPGAITTRPASRATAQAIACSRPPPPMMRTVPPGAIVRRSRKVGGRILLSGRRRRFTALLSRYHGAFPSSRSTGRRIESLRSPRAVNAREPRGACEICAFRGMHAGAGIASPPVRAAPAACHPPSLKPCPARPISRPTVHTAVL